MVIRQLLLILVCGLTLLSPQILFGQLPVFGNLDFEESLVDPDGQMNFALSPEEVFPSWSFTGDYETTYLFPHLSGLPQRFLGGSQFYGGGNALAGDFSVVLAAGCSDLICEAGVEGVTISQTGFVPDATQSIRLLASQGPQPINGINAWNMSLGGFELDLIEIGNGERGANISPLLAGQVRRLNLSVNSDYPVGDGYGFPLYPFVEFDNIRFSSSAISSVPEPTGGLLLALSAMLIGIRRNRRLA